MIYTVTFNPAIDYVLHLTAPLAVGEINRTSDEACQFGGKGINVSGVLRELGCESIALGFTAGETGAWLERGLQLSGLKTRFIRLPDGMTRINVKVKGAKETEINGSGPNITPEAMQALWDNLEELGEGDILVLAGSIPSSMPQDVYQQILARLDGRGIRFVVDATRDLLVKVLPYHPFLIKPNNHELGEIFGKELNRDEEITQAARKLQQRGARNVLVSMAGDGALLLNETGAVHRIGTPKGKVVNSVGAGDSMVAGFIAGYLQSGSYSYALRLGTACGSATAFSLGLAERRDYDVAAAHHLFKILRPAVAQRHRTVPAFLRQQVGDRTADDVAAADHDAMPSGGFDPVIFQQFENPVRRGRQIGRQSGDHPPGIDRMKTVDILFRIDRFDHPLFRDMFRQRQLNDETVHLRIGVQPGDLGKQSLFGRLLGQAKHGRAEAHLAAAFLLMSDIRLARAVVPDQNGRQMRRPVSGGHESLHLGGDLLAEAGCDLLPVHNLHSSLS